MAQQGPGEQGDMVHRQGEHSTLGHGQVMDKGVGGSLSQVSNRKKGKMGKVAGKFIDLVTEN